MSMITEILFADGTGIPIHRVRNAAATLELEKKGWRVRDGGGAFCLSLEGQAALAELFCINLPNFAQKKEGGGDGAGAAEKREDGASAREGRRVMVFVRKRVNQRVVLGRFLDSGQEAEAMVSDSTYFCAGVQFEVRPCPERGVKFEMIGKAPRSAQAARKLIPKVVVAGEENGGAI